MAYDAALEAKIEKLNSLLKEIQKVKDANPALKVGHYMSYGSLLNCYREGDIGFDDAVEEMKKVDRKPLPKRTKDFIEGIKEAVRRFEEQK